MSIKGARGPGHMGDDRVTAQNLKVVLVDAERNLVGCPRCCSRRKGRSGADQGGAEAVGALAAAEWSEVTMKVDVLEHGRREGQRGGTARGDL